MADDLDNIESWIPNFPTVFCWLGNWCWLIVPLEIVWSQRVYILSPLSSTLTLGQAPQCRPHSSCSLWSSRYSMWCSCAVRGGHSDHIGFGVDLWRNLWRCHQVDRKFLWRLIQDKYIPTKKMFDLQLDTQIFWVREVCMRCWWATTVPTPVFPNPGGKAQSNRCSSDESHRWPRWCSLCPAISFSSLPRRWASLQTTIILLSTPQKNMSHQIKIFRYI